MASTSAILLWGEAVADLDELSIDNLKCGRITKEVMNYAIKHVTQKGKNHIVDWRLADFLNDLLEVGREKSDVCAKCAAKEYENPQISGGTSNESDC